jgi:hypothetical protein
VTGCGCIYKMGDDSFAFFFPANLCMAFLWLVFILCFFCGLVGAVCRSLPLHNR